MASNPPFQVEDTDEDFFDKLVNDDDDDVDFKITAKSSSLNSVGPVFGDGNESDEVKAFANLSINEVSSSQIGDKKLGINRLSGELGIQPNGEVHDIVAHEVSNGPGLESTSALESASSHEFAGIAELNSQNVGVENSSVASLSKDSGSGSMGVKVVQWTAFHTDSAQNDGSGFGSFSDFFSELGEKAVDSSDGVTSDFQTVTNKVPGGEIYESAHLEHSDQGLQVDKNIGAGVQQRSEGQDLNIEYWESLNPGWKIDPNTGEWYQVDGYEAGSNLQGNAEPSPSYNLASVGGATEVSYLQQSFQPVSGLMAEDATTQNVTNWTQASQLSGITGTALISDQVRQGATSTETLYSNQLSSENQSYPSHMYFDPQYPDWYFDMIAQEWKSLEAYNMSSSYTVHEEKQNGFASTGPVTANEHPKTFDAYAQVSYNGTQGFDSHGQNFNWDGSLGNYNQQDMNAWQKSTVGLNTWQPASVEKNESTLGNGRSQQLNSFYGQDMSRTLHNNQQVSMDYGIAAPSYQEKSRSQHEFSPITTTKSNFPSETFSQQYGNPRIDLTEHKPVSNDYNSSQNSFSFSQQQFHGSQNFSYAPTPERSSAGRPPHALVTFGFGGKLIVAKDNNSAGTLSFGSQNPVGTSISVINLKEFVAESADGNVGLGTSDYFRALCLQSFPGPLSGGSGLKELYKWLDERIEDSRVHHQEGDALRLLLSLLKLSCQYYGKLRSPIGSDTLLKETDAPEVAVARLFASAKGNVAQFNQYGAVAHCLQRLPSEGQMQATAADVQNLLVSGRKIEALQCAQEGQLWGPAIALAAQLGDQFYVETVKQMALRQLVPGSPLRTLCLLIAGKPADVFSLDTPANSSMLGSVNMNQPAQVGLNGMLGDWEENLAVITANRTKNDELVLLHLGDCMWKERNDVIAAHICYLVAEASFEPYSETSRLCLVGADHWKCPRTYASPEAIQRTEIYENSKVVGNAQFTLLPFQAYKFVYAQMLAEVGRIPDALKYCQSVLKCLKTARGSELENLRQSVLALEDRIKTHQQGGFSTNLAPAKIMGKLLNLLDSTAHRVVGGLPPPVPSASVGSPPANEQHQQPGSRVSTSQSTMAISDWAADNSRMTMQNRSVSEPDFGRSPRQGQVDSSKEATSVDSKDKSSGGGGTPRLGRFGFGSQLLQKTVGFVLRPRQGKQAKLGDTNKFYYDEKLKRWVEEGAAPPAEEPALPPPPTSTNFQNGMPDYNLKTALKSEGTLSNGSPDFKSPLMDHGPGIPPLPPTSNQYSARGRSALGSRYVDTFNKDRGNQTTFSPSLPSNKPATTANPNMFFVPTPISSQDTFENTTDNRQEASLTKENTSSAIPGSLPQSPAPPSSMTMQRFGSLDSISAKAVATNSSFSAASRRTASWSGSFVENNSPPPKLMPSASPLKHSAANGSFGDLHEVEL